MRPLTLTVPGDPVPKGRPRRGPNGRFYTPPRTAAAEELLQWAFRATLAAVPDWDPVQRFSVGLEFHVSGQRRADLDNLAKTVLDAANGFLWADDSQVDVLVVRRLHNSDEPRTVIYIEPLETP